MKIHRLHSWNVTPTEAVALQREMADRIQAGPPLHQCELVAGADVSYARFSPVLHAGVVVLRLSDFCVIEQQRVVFESKFPYVPGLLSFREVPPLLEVFAKVRSKPDVVLLDGQGMAHPRRIGYASHAGLFLDVPTVGCAKSVLVGTFQEPLLAAGAITPLLDKGETIGMAVRTKRRTKPIFVSVGHRIDLASAVRLVLQCCRGYRVPEPTRLAHQYVNALRRGDAC